MSFSVRFESIPVSQRGYYGLRDSQTLCKRRPNMPIPDGRIE